VILESLAVVAVILAMGTTLVPLISKNWRWAILALALQYLAVFWFISMVWPTSQAVIKLVVGWMVSAVLGSTQPAENYAKELNTRVSSRLFRILAAGMIWMLVFSAAPILADIFPTGLAVLWGGLTLICMGLLQLGLSNQPSRVIIGLLTVLSGFEILYAVVETSVLVTGLLAIINLGLSMVGSYILSSGSMEESR
jgi:hypothetical protein